MHYPQAAAVADADVRSETDSSSSEDSDIYLGRPSRRVRPALAFRVLSSVEHEH